MHCQLAWGVFTSAGAGVKTNIVFFTKGKSTEKILYYDLSDIKVLKKNPLTADHFADFFKLLPTRGDSERSWTVTREKIEAKNYDLKAVNPNAPDQENARGPEDLIKIIETQAELVPKTLSTLKGQ